MRNPTQYASLSDSKHKKVRSVHFVIWTEGLSVSTICSLFHHLYRLINLPTYLPIYHPPSHHCQRSVLSSTTPIGFEPWLSYPILWIPLFQLDSYFIYTLSHSMSFLWWNKMSVPNTPSRFVSNTPLTFLPNNNYFSLFIRINRYFAGRQISASFYDEGKYERRELASARPLPEQ